MWLISKKKLNLSWNLIFQVQSTSVRRSLQGGGRKCCRGSKETFGKTKARIV
jgi:hypothetical protein